LQLNSFPEWSSKYVDYQHLKKIVYSLEREQLTAPEEPAERGEGAGSLENESALLLGEEPTDTDRSFVPHLDRELRKVVDFYCEKEKHLFDDLAVVDEHMRLAESEFARAESEGSDADISGDDTDASDIRVGSRRRTRPRSSSFQRSNTLSAEPLDDLERGQGDASPSERNIADKAMAAHKSWLHTFGRGGSFRRLRHSASVDTTQSDLLSATASDAGSSGFEREASLWTSSDEYAIDLRLMFKRRLSDLYMQVAELQQFVRLNATGMKKILKKYDKITQSHLQDRYMEQVVFVKYPFQQQATVRLEEALSDTATLYARVATHGDVERARSQLRSQLREEVVWHRNTVWREMINIERRAQAASLEQAVVGAGGASGGGHDTKPNVVNMPCGRLVLPHFVTLGTVNLVVSILVFILLLKAPALRMFDRVEEQNCLAMLVFCTMLWVTEVIPLFVTSLLVPFLIVVLRIGRVKEHGHHRRMTAPEASHWMFEQMFAPTILVLLGGFTLAAALSKYGIDKVLATRVLRLAGTQPRTVLLAHMLVACFASMWVSNVAAPVLLFSLVQPILRNLPPNSSYATSMVMGIALASNIGGQTSPIASPQNLIALQYMKEPLNWMQWFAITIPVSGASLIAIWLLLLACFGSGRGTVIKRIPDTHERFTKTQWFISAVCVGTIVLWCMESKLEPVVGDMGVIAILPLVLFFGTGILSKEDFNNFLWTIVFLAMGGIALGKGVSASGLLGSLDHVIQGLVHGLPVWGILFFLLCIGLVVATFISHTVAAVLLVPIAARVGESLDPAHPQLLIMATVLTASSAMGLPISGFPNMTAINLEDEVGHRYVSVRTFLRVGIPASLLGTAIIGTLGYVVMSLLGL